MDFCLRGITSCDGIIPSSFSIVESFLDETSISECRVVCRTGLELPRCERDGAISPRKNASMECGLVVRMEEVSETCLPTSLTEVHSRASMKCGLAVGMEEVSETVLSTSRMEVHSSGNGFAYTEVCEENNFSAYSSATVQYSSYEDPMARAQEGPQGGDTGRWCIQSCEPCEPENCCDFDPTSCVSPCESNLPDGAAELPSELYEPCEPSKPDESSEPCGPCESPEPGTITREEAAQVATKISREPMGIEAEQPCHVQQEIRDLEMSLVFILVAVVSLIIAAALLIYNHAFRAPHQNNILSSGIQFLGPITSAAASGSLEFD